MRKNYGMWNDGSESSAVNSQCGNQNINIHYSQILTKRYRSFAAVFRRGSISGFIPLSVSQSKFNTLNLKCIYDMMQFKFYIVLYNYLNLNFFSKSILHPRRRRNTKFQTKTPFLDIS